MRISDKTAEIVQELTQIVGCCKQSIIEDAIQRYLCEQFLKKTTAEYKALKKDKAA